MKAIKGILVITLSFMPFFALAQIDPPIEQDSYSPSNFGSIDMMIVPPSDAVMIEGYNQGTDPWIIYSTSTEYTVYSGAFFSGSVDTEMAIGCGNNSLSATEFLPYIGATAMMYQGYIGLHCNAGESLELAGGGDEFYMLWIVPRDIRRDKQTSVLDFNFMFIVISVLLMLDVMYHYFKRV